MRLIDSFENDFVRIIISDKPIIEKMAHKDPAILFVLEGSAEVIISEKKWVLGANDYVSVNSDESYNYTMQEVGLIGTIFLKYQNLELYLDLHQNDINCNSMMEKDDSRNRLRSQIKDIFGYYLSKDEMNAPLFYAAVYQLVFLIHENCMSKKSRSETHFRTGDEERRKRIEEYIHENYNQRITLKDLSRETWFSEAYLSKYIKKKFEKNFYEVLTDYRLKKAVKDVLETDNTLVKIAMDNGFPNSVAFNKAFKKIYHCTLSEFRKNREKPKKEEAFTEENDLSEKIEKYIRYHEIGFEKNSIGVDEVIANLSEARVLQNFWSKMINGGLARDLLRADMQEHLLILKKELGFTHIRIWDIYSPEMMLYDGNSVRKYNFSKLDIVFDFLHNNQMHPYLEMGFKPVILLKGITNYMLQEERKLLFGNKEEYAAFLEQLLRHYISRYGVEEVEHWYFEQWQDTRYKTSNDYFDYFETLFTKVKSFSPEIKVGGPGINNESSFSLETLLENWKNRYYYPDFISIYGYPYDEKDMDNEVFCRSLNSNYLKDLLEKSRKMFHEIHLSEWNFTVANRNCMNDSTFKGAYIVKNLLDMLGKADLAGYWFGSDLFSEYYDTRHLIDGSGGLLTKDGIRKPAFYGFQFFNKLGNYFLARNGGSIITTNLHDSYFITCHNYKHPNSQYYKMEEDRIKIQDQQFLFDQSAKQFHFVIQGVKNGKYQVKKRLIDSTHGSIQDEWNRMDQSDDLNAQDIEYLQQICVPHITIETIEVENNCLDIQTNLQANAIEQIHIFYLM